MKKFFLLFTALCILSGFAAPMVSALELRLENTFDSKLDVAVVYFDSKQKEWRTRGWYTVNPHSTRTITFKSSKPTAYFYSQLAGRKIWWGKGDLYRFVRGPAFSYFDSETCPDGARRRKEKFTKYKANKNGIIHYKPQNKKKTDPKKKTSEAGSLATMESELLKLINANRREAGVNELRMNNTLREAARHRAGELSKSYSHTRPDGRKFHTVLTEYGLKPTSSAENIAMTSSGVSNAARFNKMFYNSQGHRENMLNSRHASAGIGFYKVGDTYYCAELFTGK